MLKYSVNGNIIIKREQIMNNYNFVYMALPECCAVEVEVIESHGFIFRTVRPREVLD